MDTIQEHVRDHHDAFAVVNSQDGAVVTDSSFNGRTDRGSESQFPEEIVFSKHRRAAGETGKRADRRPEIRFGTETPGEPDRDAVASSRKLSTIRH
jgi:hypothetical protein